MNPTKVVNDVVIDLKALAIHRDISTMERHLDNAFSHGLYPEAYRTEMYRLLEQLMELQRATDHPFSESIFDN